jgi:hypothetical protein
LNLAYHSLASPPRPQTAVQVLPSYANTRQKDRARLELARDSSYPLAQAYLTYEQAQLSFEAVQPDPPCSGSSVPLLSSSHGLRFSRAAELMSAGAIENYAGSQVRDIANAGERGRGCHSRQGGFRGFGIKIHPVPFFMLLHEQLGCASSSTRYLRALLRHLLATRFTQGNIHLGSTS